MMSTAPTTRVIRRYNAFQLFAGLLWWLPVFYVFQRSAGLSDTEIFSIQSIFYLAFCLFDIPTGMIADRFDYRRCLQGGAIILVVANLIPVWQPTFARIPDPVPADRVGALAVLRRGQCLPVRVPAADRQRGVVPGGRRIGAGVDADRADRVSAGGRIPDSVVGSVGVRACPR